ncbi:MAG TPA: dephospho-CoA kinase [Micropepsaceae bacterium]|nr:dephospho-CoA kinase [Micropepsaceae bacterium]
MAKPRRTRPFTVGLTGSIGMGKTETLKLFQQLGFPVYDADAAVHALYEKGGAAVAPIARSFPQAVLGGRVDRVKLTKLVAGDEAAFQRLEAIVHPLVREIENAFLERAAESGAEIAVLDIPLLYETGGEKRMDAVVVVSAPPEVQRARVLKRPGMTLKKLEALRARQIPDAEKRAKADFVIETGQGIEHASKQVERIAAALKQRAARKS